MKKFKFSHTYRLNQSIDFVNALKSKTIVTGNLFEVYVFLKKKVYEDHSYARLGLILSKRFAKLAVTRNALKRIVRESFRIQKHMMFNNDYVVRLRSNICYNSLKSLKKIARQEIDKHFVNFHDKK